VWIQNLLPQLYVSCNITETSQTLLSSCRRYHTHLRTDQQQYRPNSREVILPHHEHNRANLVDYSVKEYQTINTPIFYARSLPLPAAFFCDLDEANFKNVHYKDHLPPDVISLPTSTHGFQQTNSFARLP
jgi:hypothetical protein